MEVQNVKKGSDVSMEKLKVWFQKINTVAEVITYLTSDDNIEIVQAQIIDIKAAVMTIKAIKDAGIMNVNLVLGLIARLGISVNSKSIVKLKVGNTDESVRVEYGSIMKTLKSAFPGCLVRLLLASNFLVAHENFDDVTLRFGKGAKNGAGCMLVGLGDEEQVKQIKKIEVNDKPVGYQVLLKSALISNNAMKFISEEVLDALRRGYRDNTNTKELVNEKKYSYIKEAKTKKVSEFDDIINAIKETELYTTIHG